MKRILIIFSTCAPDPHKDIGHWYRNFESIMQQNLSNYEVDYIISDCSSADNHLIDAQNILNNGKAIFLDRHFCLNSLKVKVGIQMSVNYSCKLMTELYGLYDYYVYWQNDAFFNDTNSLQQLIEEMDEDDAIMSPGNSDDFPYAEVWARYQCYDPNGSKVTLAVGAACNGLFFVFTGEYVEKYKFKPWPDILRANCSESLLSFNAAAIKRKWSSCKHIKLETGRAGTGKDGPSLFARDGSGNIIHICPFNSKYDIHHIFSNGLSVGLGFEEIAGMYMHDPQYYDGYFAKTNDLYKYILENLYVKKEDFNYDDNTITTFYEAQK